MRKVTYWEPSAGYVTSDTEIHLFINKEKASNSTWYAFLTPFGI